MSQDLDAQAGAAGLPGSPGAETSPEGDSLAQMRHNLRTPLNQIIGYSELLMEEAEAQKFDALLPDLQKIHTAGGQLLALINEALAPWKMEDGVVDLETLRFEACTPLNLILGYGDQCLELAEYNQCEKLLPDIQKITAAAHNLMGLFRSVSFPQQLAAPPKPASATQYSLDARTFMTDGEGAQRGAILLTDDNEMNRDMLCRRLERQGYAVTEADNGQDALDLLAKNKYDLVLLDVVMPVMDGYTALTHIKNDKHLRSIPVIMLSALDEMDNVIRCLEIGADDYMTKPFNPVMLKARISACLAKKFMRDKEREYVEVLQAERLKSETMRQKSETLLLNILPATIADRLKQGESAIADHFEHAAVLFANIADFNQVTTKLSPAETLDFLNDIFSQFDWLAELHGLEKIKTTGDTYVAAAGVPEARTDPAACVAEMALEMQKAIKRFNVRGGFSLSLRIGLSAGPVLAGIIGRKKFIYDLWGDPVRFASRLEEVAAPDTIRVCPAIYKELQQKFTFTEAAPVELKRREPLATYCLVGRVV